MNSYQVIRNIDKGNGKQLLLIIYNAVICPSLGKLNTYLQMWQQYSNPWIEQGYHRENKKMYEVQV